MSGGSKTRSGEIKGGQPGAGRADQRDQGATGLADRERRCTCGDRLNGCRVFSRARIRGVAPMSDPGVHVIGAEDLAASSAPSPTTSRAPPWRQQPGRQRSRCSTRCGSPSRKAAEPRTRPAPTVDRFRWRPLRRPPSGAPWSWDGRPAGPTTRVWVRRPGQARRVYNQAPGRTSGPHSMKTEALPWPEFRAAIGDYHTEARLDAD